MIRNWINQLFGNSVPTDLAARAILIVVTLVLTWLAQRIVRWVVMRLVEVIVRAVTRVGSIELQFEHNLSQQLVKPAQVIVIALGLRVAFALASTSLSAAILADRVTANIITLALFWALFRIVDLVAQYYVSLSANDTSPLDETIVRFARQLGTFLIFVFAVVLILQQWGQDVGALVAGLGIASLAVALAAQDALGNIIGYFAIVTDAPFKVGDFIIIDDVVKGHVKEISFRSTRIRTIDNSVMSIPNKTIANANVINWARTRKRRLDMIVGVTYSTTAEQIRQVIAATRDMLEGHPIVMKDRMVVDFVEFADSSLNIRLSMMVRGSSWQDLEAAKTAINLEVMQILKAHDVSVAFPTRTIHIEGADAPYHTLNGIEYQEG